MNGTHHFKGPHSDIQFQFKNKYVSVDDEIGHNYQSFRHFCLPPPPFDFDKYNFHNLYPCEGAKLRIFINCELKF